MKEANGSDLEILRQKLNLETTKIRWGLLDHYQQQDSVIEVTKQLDLIDVACEFVRDNRVQVKTWLDQLLINKVSNAQAQVWKAEDREIWAVVVAPWALVQDSEKEE